jgi:Skp family chaperone for outer membrane proteins
MRMRARTTARRVRRNASIAKLQAELDAKHAKLVEVADKLRAASAALAYERALADALMLAMTHWEAPWSDEISAAMRSLLDSRDKQ